MMPFSFCSVLSSSSNIRGCSNLDQILNMSGEEPHFHVHFGLGRIAIGLVLPSLSQGGARYSILQRSSSAWKSVTNSDSPKPIEVKVNGEKVTAPIKVVKESSEVASALSEDGPHIFLTDDVAIVKAVVRAATSFSCSLGVVVDKVLLPIFDHLDDRDIENERPILFACENDFGPVRELASKVRSKVKVVECMVDRVCTEREINADAGFINCEAEPWSGRVVILEPLKPEQVPFGGNTVIPSDPDTAKFYYLQKFLIVNGAHGVMGFVSLREAGTTKETLAEEMFKGKMPLLTLSVSRQSIVDEFRMWQKLRCAYLIHKFGMNVVARALHVDAVAEEVYPALMEMVTQTEERIWALNDDVPRVMENEPPRMYAQRLHPIFEFLSTVNLDEKPDVDGFFKYFQMDFEDSKAKVADLCNYATKICEGFDEASSKI